MFGNDFCNVLMQNEPKVEMSSDVPRKSSANFENLRKAFRIAFEQHSDNLGDLRSGNCSRCNKLLERKKAEQLVESPISLFSHRPYLLINEHASILSVVI